MLSIFPCTFWPSVCFLWRKVYLDLLPVFFFFFHLGFLFFLILSCMSCLCILEINPLSVASFAYIFSHSMCCLSILFMFSLVVQKLLSLTRSNFLFLFYIFIFITLGGRSKKVLLRFTSKTSAYIFL